MLPLLAAATLPAQPLVEGKADSAVRVVIYEDLQCSDCAAFRKMMDATLLPRFGARVAFEHRDFPLAKHAWARKAAIAARHFAGIKPELGIAWRRYILERIPDTREAIIPVRIREFASLNGADADRAVQSLGDRKLADAVENDFQDGIARGVSRTPTIFVDGAPFIEPSTPDEIAEAIEKALR
ncbi:MAG: DsbA family protein [Bryobacteraceae bacterium]